MSGGRRFYNGFRPRNDIQSFERNVAARVLANSVQFWRARHAIECFVNQHQFGGLTRCNGRINFFRIRVGCEIGGMGWELRQIAVAIAHIVIRLALREVSEIVLHSRTLFVKAFLEVFELLLRERHGNSLLTSLYNKLPVVPRALSHVPEYLSE